MGNLYTNQPSFGSNYTHPPTNLYGYGHTFQAGYDCGTALPYEHAALVYAQQDEEVVTDGGTSDLYNPLVQQAVLNSYDVEDDRKMPAGGLAALSTAADLLTDTNEEPM